VLPIRFVDNQKDFAQKLRNYLAAKGDAWAHLSPD
jgi:hypothetical protein